MRNKIFVILLCLIPLISHAKVLEFYDGYMYSELKGRYSKNTNFPNKLNEVFQQIEMKMKLNITTNIEGYGFFKTQYAAFHSKKEDRLFYINSLGVKYKFSPVAELKLGSMLVNYSPYILFAYPWYTDTFRGIEFKVDRNDLTFQVFAAFNGEDPDESVWQESNPHFSTNIDYGYNTIDIGYDEKGIRQTYPAIWGGIYLRKSFERNEFLMPEFKLYYLYENYQINNISEFYSQVFNNHIAGAEIDLTFLSWINFDMLYSACLKKYDEYTINEDYYGFGKDFYELNKTVKQEYPDAVVVKTKINDFWGNILGAHNLRLEHKYESLDYDYNPVYMAGNSYDTRTLQLPGDTIVSGRKCNSFVIMQDFAMDISDENIKKGISVGYGYSQYIINYPVIENNIRPSSYMSFSHSFKDITIIEQSIRTSLVLSKMFRIHFKYYLNKIKNGLFPGSLDKINSFHILYEGDIIDNLFFQVEYGENLNYYENYSQLLIKLMIWGW